MADLNSMEFKSGQDLANDSNMIALGIIKRRPTRAERIRLKEEAEAKKDGSGKLDVDADGKEINPHVPKFIADVPWYVAEDTGGKASLRHQRHGGLGQDRHGMDVEGWYPRGQRKGPAATKYRKGACENCGAMTHTVKDCLERPRKLRAKWSHRDIQADEIIMDFDMSYEGKRDRWNGYDSREYATKMEGYERLEEARKAKREEERKADAAKAVENGLSDDEDKYEVEPNAPGYGYDERTRTSTRNLRIREDVAKYLLNDGNSAHYDPKSRSMRELPDGRKVVDDPKLQNGNQEFVRANNDDADNFSNLQKFAWQSERMGGDVHLQANPTAGEIRHKKLLQETEKKREAVRSSVLDKYGGEEHLAAPPKELLRSTEQFVEYTKTGDIIKGTPTPKTTSRYAEDVYINNHSSVYGSYYRDGRWGYACCHQFHKNSYCTGTAGIEADEAAARLARGEVDNVPMAPPPTKDRATSAATVDAGQLRDAIKDGTKRKRPEDNRFQLGQRELSAAESAMISEEEWEDYQRNKVARTDDPLHSMQNLDGGV